MTTHNCLTPERHKRSEFKENNSNAKATKYNTNKTKSNAKENKMRYICTRISDQFHQIEKQMQKETV